MTKALLHLHIEDTWEEGCRNAVRLNYLTRFFSWKNIMPNFIGSCQSKKYVK